MIYKVLIGSLSRYEPPQQKLTLQLLTILQIPGGNQTKEDGCTRQYNLDQSVFGQMGFGIGSKGDCDRLPQDLRDACRWRFDWYKDAAYPA